MAPYQQRITRGSALVIVLIIVAVLAILGAVGFVFMNNKETGVNLQNAFHKTITATTPAEVKALLTEAKAGKYDAKCTYKLDEKATESTVYLHGATKIRVDTVINEKPGHLLRLGDSAYLWADDNNKGSKLPISDDSQTAKYSPDEFSAKAEQYHMTCQSVGQLSDSLFALPQGVTFTDFNAHTESSSSYGN